MLEKEQAKSLAAFVSKSIKEWVVIKSKHIVKGQKLGDSSIVKEGLTMDEAQKLAQKLNIEDIDFSYMPFLEEQKVKDFIAGITKQRVFLKQNKKENNCDIIDIKIVG